MICKKDVLKSEHRTRTAFRARKSSKKNAYLEHRYSCTPKDLKDNSDKSDGSDSSESFERSDNSKKFGSLS